MSRRSAIFLSLAALLCLGAAARAAFVSSRWKSFQASRAAIVASIDRDTGAREPLLGVDRAGNAWDGYLPLLTEMRATSIPDLRAANEAARFQGGPPALARARTLRAAAAPSLATLRDAGRRDRAHFRWDVTAADEMALPPTYPIRYAVALLAVSSRDARARGDLAAALDDSSVALQLTSDLARVRHSLCLSLAFSYQDVAEDELRDIALDPRTSRDQLATLEARLATLDRSFPGALPALESELAQYYRACARAVEEGRLPSATAAWRHGFSMEAHYAWMAENYEGYVALCRRREPLSWEGVFAREEDPGFEEDFVHESLTALMVPSFPASERMVRESRARLRLARAAALERLGERPGSPRWPVDPFTLTPIARREEGGKVVLSSVGSDGRAGGAAAWRPSDATGVDLVVEIAQ